MGAGRDQNPGEGGARAPRLYTPVNDQDGNYAVLCMECGLGTIKLNLGQTPAECPVCGIRINVDWTKIQDHDAVAEGSAEAISNEPPEQSPTEEPVRGEGIIASTKRLERCSACGESIALEPPVPNFKASAWICTTCGAIYFGRSDGGAERRGVIRMDSAVQSPFVVGTASSIAAESVLRLAKSLAADEFTGPERRRHKRYRVVVPVLVLPLASDFRIDGEAMQMMTRNVSLGGAALIHTRFVDAPYLALDFMGAGLDLLQVVFKVLRVRSLGLTYEVGGEFISQMSPAPK
jgi:hypothetical protein